MTRGMKGCYVYVCDDNLRNYMKDAVNKMKPFEYPETTPTYAAVASEEPKYLQ